MRDLSRPFAAFGTFAKMSAAIPHLVKILPLVALSAWCLCVHKAACLIICLWVCIKRWLCLRCSSGTVSCLVYLKNKPETKTSEVSTMELHRRPAQSSTKRSMSKSYKYPCLHDMSTQRARSCIFVLPPGGAQCSVSPWATKKGPCHVCQKESTEQR